MDSSMAVLALVMSLYHEARGEGPEGMRVVADTIYTRVHDGRWPNDYTKTILHSKQFAWVRKQGIHQSTDLIALQHRVLHSKSITPKDLLAYRQATKISREVLSEGYKPKYKFTHFYSKSQPYWAVGKRKTKIGRHYFLHM